MPTIKVNSFGKGGSIAKTASPNGVSTMNKVGAPKGVNPNKGYPTAGNVSGDQGGAPGIGNKGIGSFGASSAAGLHMGGGASGHVMSESKRSSNTGYKNPTTSSKPPSHIKAGPGIIGSTGGKRRGP